MSWIISLFASEPYPFTIDRIEPPWAVVEWDNLELSHLPLSVFPDISPPEEGEHYTIRLIPSRAGYPLHNIHPIILQDEHGLIAFPESLTIQQLDRLSPSTHQADPNACTLFRLPTCYSLLIQSVPQPPSPCTACIVLD